MRKRELLVSSNLNRRQVERLIELWAKREGAVVRPMGRLARAYRTMGQTMHWHVSPPKEGMGTIEVTYVPSTGELTVLVHDNRRGVWAGKLYGKLAEDIKKRSRRSSS